MNQALTTTNPTTISTLPLISTTEAVNQNNTNTDSSENVTIVTSIPTIAPTTMRTYNLSANLTIVTNVTCFVKFQNDTKIIQVNCLDASK